MKTPYLEVMKITQFNAEMLETRKVTVKLLVIDS